MRLKKRMNAKELKGLAEQWAKITRNYSLDTHGTSGMGYVERRGITIELNGVSKDYQVIYSARGYGTITDDIVEYNGRWLEKYGVYANAVNSHFDNMMDEVRKMSKSLMISIRPKHLLNILNGDKTLELRKTVPKDFKGWVYLYCTKSKPYYEPRINGITNQKMWNIHNDFFYHTDINGKVVARFWFDEYIAYKYYEDDNSYFAKRPQDFGYTADEVIKRLCLSRDEFKTYGKGKDLYAWHIKKLEIFNTPKSLSDFYKANLYATGEVIKEYEKRTNDFSYRLQRPPQSWQYVYTKELENDNT